LIRVGLFFFPAVLADRLPLEVTFTFAFPFAGVAIFNISYFQIFGF